MPKPRDSVVSWGVQPHPETLPPVIHVDLPRKVGIGTQGCRGATTCRPARPFRCCIRIDRPRVSGLGKLLNQDLIVV